MKGAENMGGSDTEPICFCLTSSFVEGLSPEARQKKDETMVRLYQLNK